MIPIDIKEINPLKYADTLLDDMKEKGLLQMIMNKTFTFFVLQDGTLSYYNSAGTSGVFEDRGEGRTFCIFNEATNIIVRGDSSGRIFFDKYQPETDKWMSAVDTFFVENNNRLSFHHPSEPKMYFFVGEDVLLVYTYSFILLDAEGAKTKDPSKCTQFAVLVQNVEEVQLRGVPSQVLMSQFGLFIVQKHVIQFYRFATEELAEIPLDAFGVKESELRSAHIYIHPQTSDVIFITELGVVYVVDARASILLPLKIGTITIPKEPYSIQFYHRFLVILTDRRMTVYDFHSFRTPSSVDLQQDYDVSSLVAWNNPDVSVGFYSNALHSFNEFLFNDQMHYTGNMKEGMLHLLVNDFKGLLAGTVQLGTSRLDTFLDRLGNDLPLLVYLSTRLEYRQYAVDRFNRRYSMKSLKEMSADWSADAIADYFRTIDEVPLSQAVALPAEKKRAWNPQRFNLADITVQLCDNPTEEKIESVYRLLGITVEHQVINIPEEVVESLVSHRINWLEPLIIPLLKLRPYELLQHMIITTDNLPRLDIIMLFQQAFVPIQLYKRFNTLNRDQKIVYAIFTTIVQSFDTAVAALEDELLPILLERLVAFPLDKLGISYRTLCAHALHCMLVKENNSVLAMVFTKIMLKYSPSTVQSTLETMLQEAVSSSNTSSFEKQWLINKLSTL